MVGSVPLDNHWVQTFTSMATKMADQLERQAQKDQFQASMNWLQEGPAKGLRRQHQYTKVRGGWVPSAMVTEDVAEAEDRTAEDGISLEQLRSVLCPPDTVVLRHARCGCSGCRSPPIDCRG